MFAKVVQALNIIKYINQVWLSTRDLETTDGSQLQICSLQLWMTLGQ